MNDKLNRNSKKRWTLATLAATVVTLGLPLAATAARIDEEAVVLAAADVEAATFVNNADGSVTITFPTKNPNDAPVYSGGQVKAEALTSSGAFVGDYTAAQIAGVKFRIKSNGHTPGSAKLVLVSVASDGVSRRWANPNVTISAVADEWAVTVSSMDIAAGWDRRVRAGESKGQLWTNGLQNVQSIGVELSHGGYELEEYTIDDFRLVDVNGLETEPAVLSLQEALMARFGVESVGEVGAKAASDDTDEDGMTDLDEIQTDYDPDFENATFQAEVVRVEGDTATVRWRCRKDRSYTLLRRSQLVGGTFTEVDGVVDVVPAETGYMTVLVRAVDGESYFYRVRKKD